MNIDHLKTERNHYAIYFKRRANKHRSFRGLRYIVRHQNYVLKSDGLDNYEYMYCKDVRGIYYEDDALIGSDVCAAYERLMQLGWPQHHKFYLVPKDEI